MKKRIVLLGATGSIGKNTLDIIKHFPDLFELVGFSYHSNKKLKNTISEAFPKAHSISTFGIEDIKEAAAFRGGKCISKTMARGDMYSPLQWQCHNGHCFDASPYLVLKTGHWCPECCSCPPWNFGELAKHIPFYAQLRYDDHGKDETESYSAEDGRDILAYEK